MLVAHLCEFHRNFENFGNVWQEMYVRMSITESTKILVIICKVPQSAFFSIFISLSFQKLNLFIDMN